MAKFCAALALLLLISAPARAENPTRTWFGDYLKGLPTATTPLGSQDRLPVFQGNTVRVVPGASLGIPLVVPPCPDTGGQHLNYVNGAFVCGTGGAVIGGTTLTADDGATALTADDGTTPLTDL